MIWLLLGHSSPSYALAVLLPSSAGALCSEKKPLYLPAAGELNLSAHAEGLRQLASTPKKYQMKRSGHRGAPQEVLRTANVTHLRTRYRGRCGTDSKDPTEPTSRSSDTRGVTNPFKFPPPPLSRSVRASQARSRLLPPSTRRPSRSIAVRSSGLVSAPQRPSSCSRSARTNAGIPPCTARRRRARPSALRISSLGCHSANGAQHNLEESGVLLECKALTFYLGASKPYFFLSAPERGCGG